MSTALGSSALEELAGPLGRGDLHTGGSWTLVGVKNFSRGEGHNKCLGTSNKGWRKGLYQE